MVVLYLKHSKSPAGKVVPITVALDKEVLVASTGSIFPDLQDPEGDGIWILSLSTTERDVDGNPIPPEIVNIVSEETLHIEIEAALGRLGSKVDWGTLRADTRPPKLEELVPSITQTTDVPITTPIKVRILEKVPSAGLDLSTLQMKLNGFNVITSGVVQSGFDVEYRGNIFDLTVIHRPLKVVS